MGGATGVRVRASERVCVCAPLQPLALSLAYPAGQSPHNMDPSVLVHLRLLSQPPLFFRHPLTSVYTRVLRVSVLWLGLALKDWD